MKYIFISLIILVYIINMFIIYLQYKSRNNPLKENVSDVYDKDRYSEWKNYKIDKLKLKSISTTTVFLITIILYTFNLHFYIFEFVNDLTNNMFLEYLLILLILSLISFVVDIIFNYYETFIIEEKYNFNKLTKKLFVRDTIIKVTLGLILEVSLLFFLGKLFNSFDNVYLFLTIALSIVFIFILLMPLLQPIFSKIFNKTTPLEEGKLKDKILNYANSVNFPVENIYVIDASKRSSKSNAYFLGYGKKRRIVLFDTLTHNMSDEEIVAVLAHEAGHAKHKDFLRLLPLTLLTLTIILVSLFFLVSFDQVSISFNFNEANFLFGALLFFEIFPLIGFMTGIITNAFSRKIEYSADKFSKETYSKEKLISALKSLSNNNLVDLSPHPIIVLLNYSHPPLDKRIERINS